MQVLHALPSRSRRIGSGRAAFVAVFLALGCSGNIEVPDEVTLHGSGGARGGRGGSSNVGGTGSISSSGSGGGTSSECAAPSPGTAPLRRLSNAEYRNTVSDLFQEIPDFASVVAAATSEFPTEPESLGFHNSAQFLTVQSLVAQQYMAAAEVIAEQAAQASGVVSCTPDEGEEMTCARSFIQEFGERAYRRPLTAEETTRYETQFQNALDEYDFETGVEWTIFGMLQAPAFLYRVERGLPSSAAATRPTPHETASRLSYLFWQSQPDAALREAAANGELDSPAQIAERARGMLADPRSQRLFRYFAEWLDLDRLADFSRDPEVFPDVPDDLAELYNEETKSFVMSLLGRPDGGFVELLTAPYTYANGTLADFYGLDGPSGTSFVRVDDSRRSGILTQAMLAAQDKPYRTSIVRRGLKVRTGLLCQTVNAPPNDVQLNLDSIAPGLSQRDRLAQHRENPSCAGCHALLDPIGVVFESFDAVGRYRTRDEDDQTIDTSAEIGDTLDANGEVRDVRELGALLAGSSEVRDCYVTQTFRYFFGRDVEPADACSLAALKSRFAERNLSLSELLVELTQTDTFLYRPTLEVSP
ncbi:MAG TPA: DUF1592 domain-containing protein [Polyangiaceae bacterium]